MMRVAWTLILLRTHKTKERVDEEVWPTTSTSISHLKEALIAACPNKHLRFPLPPAPGKTTELALLAG